MRKILSIAVVFAALAFGQSFGQEPVDLDMVNKIRYEGLHNSKVMETVAYLTDVIGPRLTGSPSLKRANEWTRDQLKEMGLENAHLEGWEFGRGWSFSKTSVHMVSPRQTPLLALPQAWTPGTDGPVIGTVLKARIESEKDIEKYKGKLAGKILFVSDAREITENEELDFQRYSEEELSGIEEFQMPRDRRWGNYRERAMARMKFRDQLNQFLVDEKVVATVEISSRDNGVVRVGGGGSREVGGQPGVTAMVMAAEHYNWILRLVEDQKTEVTLEVDVAAQFHDEDTKSYNTIADFPGTDKADEVVILGGHIDSWHAGTGATDDASGVAIVMEAVRILKAIGAKPRRTIRVGLWGGEEQGFLGSVAYVKEHLADREEPTDPEQKELPEYLRNNQGKLILKPGHEKMAAYFNFDNGGGKIRGIYAQENVAVGPIFGAWLQPLADLGAKTVTYRNTSGTDHLPFDRVGLPGFQFIQDSLDYSTRTHHTNLDVLDHLRREDLMQAAIVMATFVYHAAMRDELLPRKPMPESGN